MCLRDRQYPGADVPRPAEPPNRKTVVSELAFDALLDACKESKNEKLYPLVVLLLNTGMRPSEAVLLRWRQVLLRERVIDLTITKTEPRRVPLSQECIDILTVMENGTKPHERVFITEEVAQKDKPVRFFRRAFEQACIRAKINRPKKRDVSPVAAKNLIEDNETATVTLYTLRHTAATYLIMAGVDIRTVADILGHKNISQTMKYTHMADKHKLAAVDMPNLPWKKTTE
jgi:integrase